MYLIANLFKNVLNFLKFKTFAKRMPENKYMFLNYIHIKVFFIKTEIFNQRKIWQFFPIGFRKKTSDFLKADAKSI